MQLGYLHFFSFTTIVTVWSKTFSSPRKETPHPSSVTLLPYPTATTHHPNPGNSDLLLSLQGLLWTLYSVESCNVWCIWLFPLSLLFLRPRVSCSLGLSDATMHLVFPLSIGSLASAFGPWKECSESGHMGICGSPFLFWVSASGRRAVIPHSVTLLRTCPPLSHTAVTMPYLGRRWQEVVPARATLSAFLLPLPIPSGPPVSLVS